MSKPLWILLLIITGALALWRGTVGATKLWNYEKLSTSVPGHVHQIEVVPKGSKYALQAVYAYGYEGKTYTKKMLLEKPYHLNRASAESAVKQLKGMDWQVYLDPKAPHFSSLESQFPIRAVVYGVCLVGVFIYFVYMRIHLEFLSRAM